MGAIQNHKVTEAYEFKLPDSPRLNKLKAIIGDGKLYQLIEMIVIGRDTQKILHSSLKLDNAITIFTTGTTVNLPLNSNAIDHPKQNTLSPAEKLLIQIKDLQNLSNRTKLSSSERQNFNQILTEHLMTLNISEQTDSAILHMSNVCKTLEQELKCKQYYPEYELLHAFANIAHSIANNPDTFLKTHGVELYKIRDELEKIREGLDNVKKSQIYQQTMAEFKTLVNFLANHIEGKSGKKALQYVMLMLHSLSELYTKADLSEDERKRFLTLLQDRASLLQKELNHPSFIEGRAEEGLEDVEAFIAKHKGRVNQKTRMLFEERNKGKIEERLQIFFTFLQAELSFKETHPEYMLLAAYSDMIAEGIDTRDKHFAKMHKDYLAQFE